MAHSLRQRPSNPPNFRRDLGLRRIFSATRPDPCGFRGTPDLRRASSWPLCIGLRRTPPAFVEPPGLRRSFVPPLGRLGLRRTSSRPVGILGAATGKLSEFLCSLPTSHFGVQFAGAMPSAKGFPRLLAAHCHRSHPTVSRGGAMGPRPLQPASAIGRLSHLEAPPTAS